MVDTTTPYVLVMNDVSFYAVAKQTAVTAAPLLLAIAGSSLTPLPCAFSLAGMAAGVGILLLIGAANLYTTVIMVRAASRCDVSGYEQVIERAGGASALRYCEVALVVLLFGSATTCLTVIQETATRALIEMAAVSGGAVTVWLATSVDGQRTLVCLITLLLLLPLSLSSMGELKVVSLLGVSMMLVLCAYVLWLATDDGTRAASTLALGLPPPPPPPPPPKQAGGATRKLAEAASTFGYAFYIQPCALPLLRDLPSGELGERILTHALSITFLLTAMAYLTLGIGGVVIFGDGDVPQDLLEGFEGRVGGVLSALFCLYLCLCFPPVVVPLREVLVRFWHRRRLIIQKSHEGGGVAVVAAKSVVESELPALPNALVTAALVGAALCVALLLNDASATCFAVTGATGVCFISYVFPMYALWSLDEARGGAAASLRGPPYHSRIVWLQDAITQRAWPVLVLALGLVVSALTLAGVLSSAVRQALGEEPEVSQCKSADYFLDEL